MCVCVSVRACVRVRVFSAVPLSDAGTSPDGRKEVWHDPTEEFEVVHQELGNIDVTDRSQGNQLLNNNK